MTLCFARNLATDFEDLRLSTRVAVREFHFDVERCDRPSGGGNDAILKNEITPIDADDMAIYRGA